MKKGTILIAAGVICISAALIITGVNIGTDLAAGRAARDALEAVGPYVEEPVPKNGRLTIDTPEDMEGHADDIMYPDYVVNPEIALPVKVIDDEEYVGILELPTMEKSLPVINEWSYARLRKSPCRFSGTPYLKNMVICAHNYSRHFGDMGDLRYGDPVVFTDMAGNVFTYEVTEIEKLDPTAFEKMTAGEYPLTLFTCTVGGASRVTVRCKEAVHENQ